MNMCIKEATAEKKNFEVFTVHENFLCLLLLFFFAVICGPGSGAAENSSLFLWDFSEHF